MKLYLSSLKIKNAAWSKLAAAVQQKSTALFFILKNLVFVAILWPQFATANPMPQGADEQVLAIARQGQELIFQRKYPEAEKLFQATMQKYPSSALGSFGLMTLYNAQMFENFDFSQDAAFSGAAKINQAIVDRIEKDPAASAWESFLCGASNGLQGFYHIRHDASLKALSAAKSARNCLERALAKDPQFLDVNLGLGMYDYWRSVFTSQFKIFPFFKDRRQEGIAQIKLAVEQGAVIPKLSKIGLMFVHLQQGQYQAGLQLAEAFLQKYPDNIIIRLQQGRFLAARGKNEEALHVFENIYAKNPQSSVALYLKGAVLMQMRSYEPAKQALEQYLATKPIPYWRALAHYRLGKIALKSRDNDAAWKHFKQGHEAYAAYKPNLDMILKMRQQSNKDKEGAIK